ncbi:MipA/OmpV family protein [Hoeflea sp.]|uniref:MipA/OmpV family protein n=1 Tax=Hoeflea sp. TaxID=1940281 RepID=UPI003B51F116
MCPIRILGAIAVTLSASTAFATGANAQDATGQSGPGISFELGAAGRLSPSYFGSSDLVLSPVPIIRLKRLELPNGFVIGGGSDQGFSLSPSFGVVGKRSASDSPELAGLNTIDAAFEFGLAAKYRAGQFRVQGALRRGFGGHEGIRGELGADYILEPDDKWTVYAGPRLDFANSTFANTYFGVTAAEASARFPAFTAGGGLISAGLEGGLRYQMDEYWAIEAGASYDRLVGDAADSPITAQGSRNQYSVEFGILRRFDIGF